MATVELLFEGFPGWSPTHGRIGWGSIALVRAGGTNLLFDTGHPGMHRLMLSRLAARKLSPADIQMVVLSHSHWDHSLGFPLFPEAEVVIGARELEWALRQAPAENPSVPGYLMRQLADHPRLRALAGDTELLPGVTMIDTPGHTPGHMSMLVSAADGRTAIAQDAIKNRAELLARTAEQTLDAAASRRSMERIASVAEIVVPGHDRAFRLEGSQARYLGPLKIDIVAKTSPDLAEQTVFSISLS